MTLRSSLSAVALAALVWPASAILPAVEWNLHVWNRLREAHRRAPDTDTDNLYRQIATYTPDGVPMGLLLDPSIKTTDAARIEYMLEYALAPHQIVPGSNATFVIGVGAIAPRAFTSDPAGFMLVHDFGQDVRLYRRTSP